MARYSDNYYLRKCFLEREQVPTQTNMIKIMSPPLAQVYFQSMNYKIKVLAGFEPPMKGGGNDWFIPPKELLENGRVVMHPVANAHLKKLTSDGIGLFGVEVVDRHKKRMEEEKKQVLNENDRQWKQTIEVSVVQAWNEVAQIASKANTTAIQDGFRQFTCMYTSSINRIEAMLVDAAVRDVQAMQDATLLKMKDRYANLIDKQAKMLYNRYTKKLNAEKARLKANFMKGVEEANKVMINQIHNLNLEKHVAIEKLRQLLESMNLACQVYVALKERDECKKEMDLSQHEQKKTVKMLQEKINLKDFEIQLAQKKEIKQKEFNAIWQKKMCEVVKKFQMFVAYSLKTLPEHAEFFINMEKLMMLQLNEAIEDPSVSSIFVPEPDEAFHTPVPRPHPFYLCCDRGYKAKVEQQLCPKHCTSSASQLPVVIVNKRCIYASCDNFEKFTGKITEYIHGQRGDDIDFEDNHIYEHNFPFKMTTSRQLLELKLESSLMQVLEKELPNVNNVPIECCVCRIPYCFCSPTHVSKLEINIKDVSRVPSKVSISSGTKIETRSVELLHEREPKWESYMQYITPKRCKCGKRAKKQLEEHLPAYMRNTSMFEETELPNYEKCTVAALKKLVKKAQGKRPPSPPPAKVESKTRDVDTQYSDQEWEAMCTCLSVDDFGKFMANIAKNATTDTRTEAFKLVGDEETAEHLSMRPSVFAMDTARSLQNILGHSPQLEEIFRATDCNLFIT